MKNTNELFSDSLTVVKRYSLISAVLWTLVSAVLLRYTIVSQASLYESTGVLLLWLLGLISIFSVYYQVRKRVHEHRLADAALRESEERFRTIFETARDSIFIKDKSLRYTQVNPAMEQLFGLPVSDLIDRTDEDLFGKEASSHITEIDTRVLEGEIIEEEHTKPINEVEKTFHVIKVPMRNSSGEIIGLCGIARDITESKRAEMKLRESKKRLSKAEVIARIGHWDWDLTNDILIWSHGLCTLYGIDESQFNRKYESFLEFVHPDDRQDVMECVEKAICGKQPLDHEHRVIRPDGTERHIHATAEIIFENGKAVQMLGVAHDITERKQMNAEREQLIDQMEERIKEMRCLYLVAELLSSRSTLKEICNDVVTIIPYGFRHSLIARARIRIDDEEYVWQQFDETEWKLMSDLVVNGESRGSLEVFYIKEHSGMGDEPFLREEQELLTAIAKTLGKAIERILARDELKIKVRELEEFNRLSVERELKMIELKKEINQLLIKSGSESKYEIVS